MPCSRRSRISTRTRSRSSRARSRKARCSTKSFASRPRRWRSASATSRSPNGFNSIRDDAKRLVDQVDDGKIDMLERGTNIWMKIARGDIADRFDKIRETLSRVTSETKNQIEREAHDPRRLSRLSRRAEACRGHGAGNPQEGRQPARSRQEGVEATRRRTVAGFAGTDPAERAKLELARDEELRQTQEEEKRYQIAKDLSDNLTIGYNTSEVIMARLMQTTSAKERVYSQACRFFSTNDSVLTALKASFTGMFGLHELTEDARGMKEGMSKSLEDLAEIGDKVQDAAVRAGYGPTIRADAVKKLVDSVVALPGALAARSSPRCASSRRRTRPRSATRSKPARSASRALPPRSKRCRRQADGRRSRDRHCRMAEQPAITPHTLDDLMIAMDVVDTIRHRDDLVRRELNDRSARATSLSACVRSIASRASTSPTRARGRRPGTARKALLL